MPAPGNPSCFTSRRKVDMSSQYHASASRQQPALLGLPTWQQQASYEPVHNHSPYVDYDHDVPNGQFNRHESRLPREPSRGSAGMQRSSLLVGNNDGHLKFLPIEPPPGYPPLDYRPAMITRTATITLFFLYVGLTAGVSCLAYVPESRIAYAVHADSYYLAVKYGPAVIGAISAFLVKSVTQDLLKMLPYISMADDARSSTAQRTVLSQYWPVLQKANTKGTWTVTFLLSISAILIMYKGLLLEVVNTGSSWEVYVHTGVALPLIAYYGLMSCYMLGLTWWLWGRQTGIRRDWPPDSLVDVMVLFQFFDIPMDVSANGRLVPEIPEQCQHARYRLGYWQLTTNDDTSIVYGIRTRPQTESQEQIHQSSRHPHASGMGNVAKRALAFWPRPYLFYPWVNGNWWICLIVTIICLIGFPVLAGTGFLWHGFVMTDSFQFARLDRVDWLNITALAEGNNVTLSHTGKTWIIKGGGDFSEHQYLKVLAANAIFGVIPALLISMVPYGIAALDPVHRFMQPLYNMSRQESDAKDCILLEYLSRSPFAVSKDAFDRGYWKVCGYSILGSLPEFLVLLPYGIPMITSIPLVGEDGRRISVVMCEFSMFAFSATSVLLLACLILLLCSLPFEKRRLPRPRMTLLDLWAICHDSRINSSEAMVSCSSRHDKERLYSTIKLWRHKYLLGLCRSSDGQRRIGFDISRRGDDQVQTDWVEWVPPSTKGFKVRKKNRGNASRNETGQGEPGQAFGLVHEDEGV